MKSKIAIVAFLTAGSVALTGCEGVHYANLLTLAVTFGLFFGTLNLGRRPTTPPAATATVSATDRPAANITRPT